MKRCLMIAIIILSGIVFYSCATTCEVRPPVNTTYDQAGK